MPKINASLCQSFEQLKDALKPENGLSSAIIELLLVREARLKLGESIDAFYSGGNEEGPKG